jgi:hypothetical protein
MQITDASKMKEKSGFIDLKKIHKHALTSLTSGNWIAMSQKIERIRRRKRKSTR